MSKSPPMSPCFRTIAKTTPITGSTNTAPKEVLYFLHPDLDEGGVEAIISERQGSPLQNATGLQTVFVKVLGMGTQWAQVNNPADGLFRFDSDTFSVVAVGYAGETTVKLEAVFQRERQKQSIRRIFMRET